MRGGRAKLVARMSSSACSTLAGGARRNALRAGGGGDFLGRPAFVLALDRNGDHLAREAGEMPQQRAHILGGLRAADQHQRARAFFLELGHRLGQHAAAILVMAAVDPDFGARGSEFHHMAARDPLQPRRPVGIEQAGVDGAGLNLRGHGAQGGDGGGGVLMLMTARQARRRQIEQAALVLEHQPAVFLVDVKIPVRDNSGSADAARLAQQDIARAVRLEADDRGSAALKNPGLLVSDFFNGAAEELLMVERNRGDDRGLRRRDHIGRVEASAEPGLQQQPVGGRVGEEMKRRRRGDLEEGDRPSAIGALA